LDGQEPGKISPEGGRRYEIAIAGYLGATRAIKAVIGIIERKIHVLAERGHTAELFQMHC
jgi:hypothetical protein